MPSENVNAQASAMTVQTDRACETAVPQTWGLATIFKINLFLCFYLVTGTGANQIIIP